MSAREQTPAYYPVFLDIQGKKCVVIGGGNVALRKVKGLLEHGAKVDVVSPELCPEIVGLAENREIGVFQRHYQTGDLQGAFIAIAATDSRTTNSRIAREARERHVLVNVVDDAELSDFIAPAIVRRGGLSIAISTAGLSPALARKIRTRLEEDFGEEYAELARLIDEVRTEVKQRGIKVDAETWQEALDVDRLVSLVKQGHRGRARDTLFEHLLKQPEEIKKV
ncbi:MAG: bifunctional precorrin-2 dehydrogenase/sirohydrochlorin ferrochelatase [Chloroflexi bacterium]|nr:bifunctional precorrin-2 dehydrogenase/sirohydrochlorin ferrochelatase [Chloroflexota bacterium]